MHEEMINHDEVWCISENKSWFNIVLLSSQYQQNKEEKAHKHFNQCRKRI